MNISNILLLGIIWILFLIVFNQLFLYFNYTISYKLTKENINNDLPDNQITAEDNANLLIPTSDQIYNPYDTNRPANDLSHQVTPNLNNNSNHNTDMENTGIDIPLVYSNDQIKDTTIKNIDIHTPSMLSVPIIDSGSGIILPPTQQNNQVLNNFNSIN
jgi:hypothetical protein